LPFLILPWAPRRRLYNEVAVFGAVEDAAAGYEAIRTLYSRRIFPTVEGVRNTVRILSRIDPKFSKLKAEDLIDESVVRKLEREGVFK
jgi:hypothetical protein